MKALRKTVAVLLAAAMILCMAVSSFATGMDNFVKKYEFEDGHFTDVNKEWFASFVALAYEMDLMAGNSATTFNPNGNVTVAETVTIAAKMHNIYNDSAYDFTANAPAGKPWYQVFVDYCVSNGIITEGQFEKYTVAATRTQFVNILANSFPKSAFPVINSVDKIPDVPAGADGADAIYSFYNAGVIAGSDKYGTFNPASNIKRCEVATILVKLADPSMRAQFTLEEKPVEVTGVSFASASYEVGTNRTVQTSVNVNPQDATDKTVTYSSSNNAVATVDANGAVKGIAVGTATITATSKNGKSGSCTVTVTQAPIEYSGRGTAAITGVNIPKGDWYCEFSTRNASRNFIVKLYYGSGKYDYNLLVNEIAPCTGHELVECAREAAVNNASLQVDADGEWTILFKPVSGSCTTNIAGTGSRVTGIFTASSSRPAVTVTSNGEHNIIIKMYKVDGGKWYDELIVNEIGAYSGAKFVDMEPGKKYFFTVYADKNWTIDFGEGAAKTTYGVVPVSQPSENNLYTGPSSGSFGSSGDYDGFPGVPDFGIIYGLTGTRIPGEDGNSLLIMYSATDLYRCGLTTYDARAYYSMMLEGSGFTKLRFSDDLYENDEYTVMILNKATSFFTVDILKK